MPIDHALSNKITCECSRTSELLPISPSKLRCCAHRGTPPSGHGIARVQTCHNMGHVHSALHPSYVHLHAVHFAWSNCVGAHSVSSLNASRLPHVVLALLPFITNQLAEL